MEPASPQELTILADISTAKSILLEARIDALQSLFCLLFKRAGVDSIDGLSLEDILSKVVRERLQQKMAGLQANNPGVAAHIQHIFEEIEKSARS